MLERLLLAALLAATACSRRSATATIDAPPAIPREMRGIWVATVRNIDWPKDTVSAERQRAELIDIFDRAAAAGFNTIVFQVRPTADALYRSDLEPWSTWLTGRQGTDPGYDPLEFAVREAHARGLELHAWINPYRAAMRLEDTATLAPSHVWNARRDIVRMYGNFLWMDPGEPESRAHSMRVVADLVRRYDIDGIHMDDYFYPYPIRDTVRGGNIPFPDSGSYARSGSTLARDDWRRANIDNFVEQMYREAHAIKPSIKVGISPFGIWRPGNPPSVQGFDQYAQLYADARKWLQLGWVDYFVPQLYWAINAPQQSFPALYDWWLGENTMRRHVWPGLATYRAAALSNNFARTEVAEQVKIIRSRPVPPGHVSFNTQTTLIRDNGVLATLRPLFTERALVPSFPWMDDTPPAAPAVTVTGRTLTIGSPERPRFWAVQTYTRGGWFSSSRWTTRIVSGDSTTLSFPRGTSIVFVSAVDHAGNQSSRSRVDLR